MRRSTLAIVLLAVGTAACGGAPSPFACADGALPCAEQVRAFQCDTLTEGTLPPDRDEVRWMLSGAKIPPLDQPSVDLAAWCSGPLEAAGTTMRVDLFLGVDGGYLTLPGHEPIWFESPPEDPAAVSARMCVPLALPAAETIDQATCLRLGKTLALDPFDGLYRRARPVNAATFGDTRAPRAVCDVRFRGGAHVRADLFEGEKGWFHLPGERRLCFVAGPG